MPTTRTHLEAASDAGVLLEYKGIKIWTAEQIRHDQDGIRKTLASLDRSIHDNAVQCLIHAEQYGDTSLMRRLLIDTIPKDGNGYRTQGIIAWMRNYSPMELTKDNINLAGRLSTGARRPWRIEEASKIPFWMNKKFDEPAIKPVFRETLLSKVNLALKEYKVAKANTGKDGKPLDSTKPFYDGLHIDKMDEFMSTLEHGVIELSKFRDATKEQRDAQEVLRKAQLDAEAAAKAA